MNKIRQYIYSGLLFIFSVFPVASISATFEEIILLDDQIELSETLSSLESPINDAQTQCRCCYVII